MADVLMTVVLGGSTDGEVRAIPVGVRPSLQYLAASLRQEIAFTSWRHALAFCEVMGIAIENREAAEQLAAVEDRLRVTGSCWICGRNEECGHGTR